MYLIYNIHTQTHIKNITMSRKKCIKLTVLKALLTRAPDRPDSVLVTLEKDSDLLRVSGDIFLALLTLEDTGFVRCESNFILLHKLKERTRHTEKCYQNTMHEKCICAHCTYLNSLLYLVLDIGDCAIACRSSLLSVSLG